MQANEQMWLQRDFELFDRLPKRVRDVIKTRERKVDVYALTFLASTEPQMLTVIKAGKADW